jgi:dTDP-4-dehydrorhamnose reductase
VIGADLRDRGRIASDRPIVSPTYVPDLVQATLDLLLDEEKGIWHLTNQGAVSWHEIAQEVASAAKVGAEKIIRAENDDYADTSLTSSRGILLRPFDHALADFIDHSEALRALG